MCMCIKNICRFFLRAQSQMNENMITYRKTKKGIRQKRAMEKEKITKDKLTKENKKETTALQAISADERKDWISLAFVQAGICVCVPAFLLGAMLAEAMPIWPAIISGSLGYLVVVIGMVITGMMGCDLGVPSCTACEAGFGKKGARFIVSIIFAVNLIGWFGIQNGVCGEAFTNGLQAMTGIHVPVVVSNTVWGLHYAVNSCFRYDSTGKIGQDFHSTVDDYYAFWFVSGIQDLRPTGSGNRNCADHEFYGLCSIVL